MSLTQPKSVARRRGSSSASFRDPRGAEQARSRSLASLSPVLDGATWCADASATANDTTIWYLAWRKTRRALRPPGIG